MSKLGQLFLRGTKVRTGFKKLPFNKEDQIKIEGKLSKIENHLSKIANKPTSQELLMKLFGGMVIGGVTGVCGFEIFKWGNVNFNYRAGHFLVKHSIEMRSVGLRQGDDDASSPPLGEDSEL